ncbi:MAG: hypothetical protein ABIZ81_16795 [Opitutaceae bacterium]
MTHAEGTFSGIVGEILRRFCEQNGKEPPPAQVLAGLGDRILAVVRERGLPPPLHDDDQGTPGEMPEAVCAPLVAHVMSVLPEHDRVFLSVPLRQLIKACFHEEFKVCRDSFREPSPDGICRRQQLTRVRQRISGAHCIDCPYWTSLPREKHLRFLDTQWQPAGREELAAHRGIFLPEDFRRLRLWLFAAARAQDIGL